MNRLRLLSLVAVLGLAGCAAVPGPRVEYETRPAPTLPPERFDIEEGRDAAVVAQFREAPAPATIRVGDGSDFAADRNRLAKEGYVLIARSRFLQSDPDARSRAAERAVAIGAEQALFYPVDPTPASSTPQPGGYADEGQSLVAYFVKYKLPFGATFRDLGNKEKQELAVTGGVRLGSVIERTPAAEANLIAGDAIVRFNGAGFTGKAAFQKLLQQYAGKAVTLTLVRDDAELERIVRLGVPRSK